MLSSSIIVPCSIESAPAQRQVDAVGAVGVDRDLLAVEVRGLDERLGLVVEHLRAEPRPMRLLTPPVVAILMTSAPRRSAAHRRRQLPGRRTDFSAPRRSASCSSSRRRARVHVAGGGRDGAAGIDDARPTTQPRAIASRSASVTPPPSPRLRRW
jgi:hypothetical protein